MSDQPIPDAYRIYRLASSTGQKHTFWWLVGALGLPRDLRGWGRPECASIWAAFHHGKDFEPPYPIDSYAARKGLI